VTFKTKSPTNQFSKSSLAVFTIPQNSFYALVTFSCFLNRSTPTESPRDSETVFFFNTTGSSSRWIGSSCTVLLRHQNISVLLREALQTEKYRATHKAGASCLGATTSHSVAFTAEPQAVFPRVVHVTNPPITGHYTRNQLCVIRNAWFIWQTLTIATVRYEVINKQTFVIPLTCVKFTDCRWETDKWRVSEHVYRS
jgi:hypothetical protein